MSTKLGCQSNVVVVVAVIVVGILVVVVMGGDSSSSSGCGSNISSSDISVGSSGSSSGEWR